MANMASTLDDQQERHYIGNLLCEEDVFGQPSGRAIETNGSSIPSDNVLPSSGPIGPSPNRTFWPEPPPPYSPCSIAPPHWASAGQVPGLMAPPPAAVPYGKTRTATAVTRTDFYQSSFGGHDEWDNMPGATMNAYMSTGMPYSSHRTVSVLKPPVAPNSTLDTMQQHHYQNMYHHHQHHLGNSPVDPRIFTAPPPRIYSVDDENDIIDSYLPQHLPPKTIKKAANSSAEDVSSSIFLPKVTKDVVQPLSKSYRDAASKKEHVISSSSLSSRISNPPAIAHHSSAIFSAGKDAGNQTSKIRILAYDINSNRQSIDGSGVVPVSCTRSNVYNEQNNGSIHSKCNITAKKGCGHGTKKVDNEFQKITHKKSKSVKSNKNDRVITDEDGIAGNQAVDASSRFDVLQSLGTQATNTVLRRVTHRSLSSVVVHRGPSVDAIASKPKIDDFSMESTERVGKDESALTEDKTTRFNQNGIKSSNSCSTQRSVFKKMIGTRREPNVQVPTDSARCNRKQRNSIKKRQSCIANYLSIMVSLVFSIIKHAVQWILNLLWDISLQLWDITIYIIMAGYASIIFNCQRFWYSMLDAQRKCWENIRLFNIKRMWTSQEKAFEWGLNENIQLPATGEEAMDRILKCRGCDAYMVLGLRADCKDDDIKRYYKKQAILVHPDKNSLNGADEAFKILSMAFDAIGTPDDRKKYNIANLHKNPLHREMEELWERLCEKMNEARNSMLCDCGSKHTRIPVESIRASEARYCKKCKLRHPAKHNDIWAETRFCGIIWVYYACLDGVVYDITQWATCSNNHLKHMKPNSHMVQYRLVTTGGSPINKNSLKQTKTGEERHKYDDFCPYNRGGLDDDGCNCSISLGYGVPTSTSQQASYRPPDRNSLNNDRPRRAGRRRKQR